MSQSTYIKAKILRINVGFILAESVGFSHEVEFNVPSPMQIADDLILNHLYATLRLSHVHDGILAQGEVQTGVPDICSRCNDDIWLPVEFEVEELFGKLTGRGGTEFLINDANDIDLAPLFRAEAMLHTPMVTPYDENNRCLLCNRTFDEVLREAGLGEDIDPRMAVLMELRNKLTDDK